MNKYISTGLGVTIIILVAIISAGAFYFFGQKENLFPTPISPIATVSNGSKACTEEAKICPDGSAVGRTGTNCEFAACPGKSAADISGWKTYQSAEFGYEIKYPASFGEPFSPHNIGNPIAIVSEKTPGLSMQVQFFLIAFGPINNLEEAYKISTRGSSYQEKYKKDAVFNGMPAIEYAGINNSKNVHALVGVLNGEFFDLIIESNNYPEMDDLFQQVFANFKAIGNEAANSLIYKNTDYGFQVTLPKGWEKYQVSVQWDKGDDKHTYFYFMLPTSDKSWLGSYDKNTGKAIPGVADIFVITATDLATWNKDLNSKECQENPNPSCPYEGSVVAKNSQYVFDAGYGNGLLPLDVQSFKSAKSAQEFLTGKFKLLP